MATRRGSGETVERSVMLALAAVILSIGFHIGGIYALSNVDFAPRVRREWKVNRFQELPPMNVQRFEGDPMCRDAAVKYTDWAIGDFLAQAAERPWFRETVFVILAVSTSKDLTAVLVFIGISAAMIMLNGSLPKWS